MILWWGLLNNELYVEQDDRRYGPFHPVDGPIPLHRYRKFQKTKTEERADRIAVLAKQLNLPRAALDGNTDLQFLASSPQVPEMNSTPFLDPDPFQEFTYPTVLLAKRAISDALGQPLARLEVEQRAFIDGLLNETLQKKTVMERVRQYFRPEPQGEHHAH